MNWDTVFEIAAGVFIGLTCYLGAVQFWNLLIDS
jgi:hypothetical protein